MRQLFSVSVEEGRFFSQKFHRFFKVYLRKHDYSTVIKNTEDAENTEDTKTKELTGKLQESISGDTNVKTNLENVQKNLSSVPDVVMESVKLAYPDYEDYIELLDNCIIQLNADIEVQETIKNAIADQESQSSSEIDMASLQLLLSELVRNEAEKSELYSRIIELQEEQIKNTADDQQSETPEMNSQTEAGKSPGAESQSEKGQQSESEGNLTEGENSQNKSSGGGGSVGGFSGSSGSGTAAMTGGETAVSGNDSSQTAGGYGLSQEEISLFGNTYDLTQVTNLLEREPTDSDNAQEILEQLEESQRTVKSQYDELTRNRRITEFEIQYTYDTSILSGKLAEYTYQQESAEWEELLAEAKSAKTVLETEKAHLDAMENGILTADQDGTAAEIFCEEGDMINGKMWRTLNGTLQESPKRRFLIERELLWKEEIFLIHRAIRRQG